MKSNSLLMEEDSDLALDGACAATPAGFFGKVGLRFCDGVPKSVHFGTPPRAFSCVRNQ
jgi:hypothetical protein